MGKKLGLGKFWCWNKDCTDYGIPDFGNIILKERIGKHQRAILRCKTCKKTFSETHGTPFFGLKTSIDEVTRALSLLPERASIRSVARLTGHKPDTIIEWIKLAGAHAKEVNEYFLQELDLDQVQVDEIWSFIKKRRKTSSRAKKK